MGPGGVMKARRVALALVLVGGLIGLYFRIGIGRVTPYQEPRLDFWGRTDLNGKEIGSFVIEELVERENYSLRLRSRPCDGAIFMTPAHIINETPEKLIASLYPAAEWRTMYV